MRRVNQTRNPFAMPPDSAPVERQVSGTEAYGPTQRVVRAVPFSFGMSGMHLPQQKSSPSRKQVFPAFLGRCQRSRINGEEAREYPTGNSGRHELQCMGTRSCCFGFPGKRGLREDLADASATEMG